ncbi:MAG: hypothetical protein AABY22_18205 [Nanoarchaeota archaeon]
MRIVYIDFNLKDSVLECYSALNCSRYGGGSVFAPYAREAWDDFHIFANPKCFENLTENEKKDKCHPLTDEQRQDIFDGKPIKDILPEVLDFDLLVHHCSPIYINTNGTNLKTAVWVVGAFEHCRPENIDLLFFNLNGQKPDLKHNKHKIYHVQLGKPVPKFQEYKKQDIIFQCSRHNNIFQSIEIVDICNRHKIPIYLGGKIDDNYPLLDIIDNKSSFWLGTLSQTEKNKWHERAKVCTIIQNGWPSPFTLGGLEAHNHGCQLWVAPSSDFWKSYIKNGVNGWFVTSEETFLEAWDRKDLIKQKDCYNSSSIYSIENMLVSFRAAFESILNEN